MSAIALARILAFEDVPTQFSTERFRYFPILQRIHHFGDASAVFAGDKPVEFSAQVGGVLVLRILARQLGKIGAADCLLAQLLDSRSCLFLGHQFARPDHQMARLELTDDFGAGVFTLIGDSNDMEAIGTTNRLRQVALVHASHKICERSRDFLISAPAQVTAFECLLTFGILDCSLLERQACVHFPDHAFSALTRRLHLL